MKRKWMTIVTVLAIGVSVSALTGCGKSDTTATAPAQNQTTSEAKSAPAVQYTCPMHPEVVKDAPGNCPKCGMKLVEKK